VGIPLNNLEFNNLEGSCANFQVLILNSTLSCYHLNYYVQLFPQQVSYFSMQFTLQNLFLLLLV